MSDSCMPPLDDPIWRTIETHSGRVFSLDDPRPEDVDPEDIAWALGHLCRFTGHVRRWYSVAAHCIHVSHLAPFPWALQGLLHDAAEAYMGDIATPIKHVLGRHTRAVTELEERILRVIYERFEVPWPQHPSVKAADLISLATEVRELMPGHHPWWQWLPYDPDPGPLPDLRNPEEAAQAYLARLKELL